MHDTPRDVGKFQPSFSDGTPRLFFETLLVGNDALCAPQLV
jgi:hypothetical protein